MRNYVIYDNTSVSANLLPLTYTRPASMIRVGILTIFSKWQRLLTGNFSHLSVEFLSKKFPATIVADNTFVAGHVVPSADLAAAVEALHVGEALACDGEVIAYRGTLEEFQSSEFNNVKELNFVPKQIRFLYDVFTLNPEEIVHDFGLITAGRKSATLSGTCTVIGEQNMIFIEEGASIEGAFLNTTTGPIYVGKQATIMEGSCVRGPFAACEHAQVNMSSRIYPGTTLGPYCKVGGELNNVVMLGYSNKAHDGFLGNAVIGEWCNIGAGTSASNLKNDYTEIKLWNYPAHRFLRTGLQFCGLIMGDHSKAGVNCMFNTATVLGVGVNIHGSGFPRNFVASFQEGSTAGFTDVPLTKFFAIAERVMARRGLSLTDADREIFEAIATNSDNYK